MNETFFEDLLFAVHRSLREIDQTLVRVEKMRCLLQARKEAEACAFSALFDIAPEQNSKGPEDERIVLLSKLHERLLAEKERYFFLEYCLRNLLDKKRLAGPSNRVFFCEREGLSEAGNILKDTANALCCDSAKLHERIILTFSGEPSWEVAEFLAQVDRYHAQTLQFADLCRDAAGSVSRLILEMETLADHSGCFGGREAAVLQEQPAAPAMEPTFPPPPTQCASYAETMVPPSAAIGSSDVFAQMPPSQPMMGASMPGPLAAPARKEQKMAAPSGAKKEKSGFFGFLKRKNKKDAASAVAEVVPPPQIDSVQFSAIAPGKVIPGKYLPINIVMYEDAYRKAVDDIVRSHGETAKETKSGYQNVERNALVKVVLTSRDVTVEDNEEERKWNGKYLDFQFAAKIPEDFVQPQILFSASVYVNDIIAARLKLLVDCEGKPKRNIQITRTDVVSAFVSYASQDRNRVAAIIQGMKKARPDMDIFFDIESLRSGEDWETTLKSEIEGRDILFLCWSRHARVSQWVDMEWRYALQSKGEDCIEPIPIESPDICPPPVELQKKHFNDKMLYIIKATMPERGGLPHLIRVKTNECIPIDKAVMCIGRAADLADIVVGDNAQISRNHASIICRDGQYYVKDCNSVNHTYVDDQMIPSNVETAIENGTKIRLANELFEFVC